MSKQTKCKDKSLVTNSTKDTIELSGEKIRLSEFENLKAAFLEMLERNEALETQNK